METPHKEEIKIICRYFPSVKFLVLNKGNSFYVNVKAEIVPVIIIESFVNSFKRSIVPSIEIIPADVDTLIFF